MEYQLTHLIRKKIGIDFGATYWNVDASDDFGFVFGYVERNNISLH